MRKLDYSGKLIRIRYVILVFIITVFSCTKKDNSNCVTCTTTYFISADVPVEGYPATTSMDVELCNLTTEQISKYEQDTQSSESAVSGGVTYSSSHSTICRSAKR